MFQFHREHCDKPWDFGDTLFFRAKPMEIMGKRYKIPRNHGFS
jgi:hypothetical protein